MRTTNEVERLVVQPTIEGIDDGGQSGDDANEVVIEQLRTATLSLGKEERDVLVLYYFESKKPSEIARTLGITIPYVTKIRKQALEHLKESIIKSLS